MACTEEDGVFLGWHCRLPVLACMHMDGRGMIAVRRIKLGSLGSQHGGHYPNEPWASVLCMRACLTRVWATRRVPGWRERVAGWGRGQRARRCDVKRSPRRAHRADGRGNEGSRGPGAVGGGGPPGHGGWHLRLLPCRLATWRRRASAPQRRSCRAIVPPPTPGLVHRRCTTVCEIRASSPHRQPAALVPPPLFRSAHAIDSCTVRCHGALRAKTHFVRYAPSLRNRLRAGTHGRANERGAVLPLANSAGGHRLGVNGLAVDPTDAILYGAFPLALRRHDAD